MTYIRRTQSLLLLLLLCVCVNGCGQFGNRLETPPPPTVEPPPPETQVLVEENEPIIDAVHQLRVELDDILSNPSLAASNIGVKVVSLANGEVLYQRDPDKLYHPASTMKLLTSATALVKLKPHFRFRTLLYGDPLPHGNVYLKGVGDPLFADDDLEQMVEDLIATDVKTIHGDIVVDETYFDDIRRGNGWMWDDGPIGGYFSLMSAMTINRNSVLVHISPGDSIGDAVRITLEPPTQYMKVLNKATTVAPPDAANLRIERQLKPVEANVLTIHGTMTIGAPPITRRVDVVDPALYCGTRFKEMLAQRGITLKGTVRYGEVPDGAIELADHISPPLSQIILKMNKSSDNLIAELLLKTVGAEISGVPGTAEKGIAVINAFLGEIGLDTTTHYALADGSGVSRYNLASASLLTNLLVYMFRDLAVMPEYLVSLPVAGVDGTLYRRMKGMTAEGILRAKTGALRGVTTLAGYTTTADGEMLAFAILMSNYVGTGAPRRALQDEIGDALTRFSRKE